MSSDEGLVGHVPYLRRFARALTGSQTLGDACVVAAIERILAGKAAGSLPVSPSIVPCWPRWMRSRRVQTSLRRRPRTRRPAVDPVQRNLAALTPVGRQAFLLVAMEEFSLQDAALVLRWPG